MTPVFCHEVSVVLCGPGGRAAVFSWDHHHSWLAHCTRHVVLVCPLKREFILCPIHMGGMAIGRIISIGTSSVSKGRAEFWVCRHAQVIGSPSLLVMLTSSSDSRVD